MSIRKLQGCLAAALNNAPGADVIARPLIEALTYEAPQTQTGPIVYRDTLESASRGFPYSLLPTPPVDPPPIDHALVKIQNVPVAQRDAERGHNGFAIDVADGVARFQGPVWALKFAKVKNVGSVSDGKGAGTHHYADGERCGDSKGRNLDGTPVRVFYLDPANLPDVGEVIPYIEDQNGLSYAVGDSRTRVAVKEGSTTKIDRPRTLQFDSGKFTIGVTGETANVNITSDVVTVGYLTSNSYVTAGDLNTTWVTVVCNVRFNSTSNHLEIKVKDVLVMGEKNTTWTSAIAYTSC